MSHHSSDQGRSTTGRRGRGLRSGLPGARRTAFLATLAGLAVAGTASAQTFPADNLWTPLEKTDPNTQVRSAIGDVLGDSQNSRDIVGNAANPAAYVASDANFYYFRVRIDSSVLQNATNFAPFAWGCVIDSNANLADYEYSTIVNGVSNPDQVLAWRNSTQQTPNDPSDPPDQPELVSYLDPLTTGASGFGYARQAPAASTFGGNADFFIDWAVQKSVFAAAGLADGTPIRVACATGANGQTLSGDFTDTASLPLLLSDPITCTSSGCTLSCSGQGNPCTSGVGECAATGTIVCVNGQATCNAVPKQPVAEICDGKDNDCDGTNDDGNPGGGVPCDSGQPGVCKDGLTTCANGVTACVSNVTPGSQTEICDDKDNDCDNTVDEGFNVGNACNIGLGACASSGMIVCTVNGAAECNAVVIPPGTEVCGNQIDEDCDGALNNGCGCVADTECGTANDGSICDLVNFVCMAGCRGNDSNNGCPVNEFCTSTDATPGLCVACLTDLNCGVTDSGQVCRETDHTCIAGCRGTGGNSCPATLKCTSTDSTIGTCVECSSDADCGELTSGQICSAANTCVAGCRGTGGNGCASGNVCTSTDNTPGQCVGCLADADCGGNGSGKVCDTANASCVEGCRGTNTTVCPANNICTSSDDTIGKCVGCVLDADCETGRICDAATSICIDGCRGIGGNGCVPPLTCTSTDATPGACVGCVTDAHCGGNTSGKVCDATSQQCILGCRGTNGNGCDTGFKCTSTNDEIGKCVVCFVDADCGGTDSGKVCAADGTCIDGCRGAEGNGCATGLKCTSTTSDLGTCVACTIDADCGGPTSGKVCEANACIDGCRGTNGNECPDGQVCSSTDDTAGTCSLPEGGAGGAAGAAGAGGTGTGGSAGKGGSAGSGGSAGKGGSAGAAGKGGAAGADAGVGGASGKGGSAGKGGAAGSDAGVEEPEAEPGTLEGGGCACATPESTSSRTPLALLMLGIAAIASRRRRRS